MKRYQIYWREPCIERPPEINYVDCDDVVSVNGGIEFSRLGDLEHVVYLIVPLDVITLVQYISEVPND